MNEEGKIFPYGERLYVLSDEEPEDKKKMRKTTSHETDVVQNKRKTRPTAQPETDVVQNKRKTRPTTRPETDVIENKRKTRAMTRLETYGVENKKKTQAPTQPKTGGVFEDSEDSGDRAGEVDEVESEADTGSGTPPGYTHDEWGLSLNRADSFIRRPFYRKAKELVSDTVTLEQARAQMSKEASDAVAKVKSTGPAGLGKIALENDRKKAKALGMTHTEWLARRQYDIISAKSEANPSTTKASRKGKAKNATVEDADEDEEDTLAMGLKSLAIIPKPGQ